MIPLRDNIQIRSFPFVTILLILSNCYVFYLEYTVTDQQLGLIMTHYSLVPADFINALTQQSIRLSDYVPLLSNLFLHGSWLHIIGNLWFLFLFGRTSESCLGHMKYFIFYLVCGIAANLVQIAFDPISDVPVIGASGAISGILGSYIFCFPRARISTLIPIFFFFTIIEIPALVFIGIWFLLQVYQGTLSASMTGSNVAWWAHIGGFLMGIGLNVLLNRRPN
ncbi:MAG: rhomboid family intramembrane serine protease [Sporomusaceae bacterium]|nr:rhomboid family intramembrane serine protease [Sporomusaceae bacterium]